MSDSNRSDAIDLLKVWFALGVMGIHTQAINQFSDITQYYIMKIYFRVGVPFFFVTTGYFWGKKIIDKKKEERLRLAIDYCKRLIRPVVIFGLFGLSWAVVSDSVVGGNWIYHLMLDLHNSIFYPRGAMWFLVASGIATLIIAYLYDSLGMLLFFAIIGYCYALLCNSYYFLSLDTKLQQIIDTYMSFFVSARNGVFVGVPLLGVGVLVAKKEKLYNDKPLMAKIFVFGIALVLYMIEVSFLRNKTGLDDESLYITTPFLAAMIFIVGRSIKLPYSNEKSKQLRKISKWIYYFHPVFNSYIGAAIFLFTNKNGMIQFLYCGCSCLLVYYIVEIKDKLSFLKKIIE